MSDQNYNLEELLGNLSQEEERVIHEDIIAGEVYEAIVSELNIPHEDELFRKLTLSMLKREARNFIVFSIWNNLSEKQNKHLRDYLNQNSIVNPEMETDDILMSFALMYDDLMDRVYEGLSKFFQDFIVKFNELNSGRQE